ncbi:WYL domain-containing protein [Leeuwenhoekiella aequorea]|uniref:hypothetical protein n=1 Tax=Leeuwenhoekiella aequorea TaxID=283736 RepID=UPI00352C250B
MNNLDILIRAIDLKKCIQFEYNKIGKTAGKRFGNPYALFILTAKSGVQSTKLHLVQTDGVSDSNDKNSFPEFRMFNIEDLSNIEILDGTFRPNHPKYNPYWEGYNDIIAKI